MTDFTNRQPSISVIDAIILAFNHMITVLFRPFNIVKWLKFGLVAFLAALGTNQGNSFNFNIPTGNGGGKGEFAQIEPFFNQAYQWVLANLTLVIIVGIAVILLIAIIWIILLYFGSRFTFVFLDGVIKNDIRIKQPYKENKTLGWSYFLWRIIFTLTALLAILLIIGIPTTFLILAGVGKGFSLGIILGLVGAGLVFIGLAIILAIIGVFTDDFVVPIMYLLKIRILQSWKIFWSILRTNKLQFFLYILLKMGLSLASILVMCLSMCVVCCVALAPAAILVGLGVLAIKYPLVWIVVALVIIPLIVGLGILTQTVLLPVTVFFRTYPLAFLEGFGEEFACITKAKSLSV